MDHVLVIPSTCVCRAHTWSQSFCPHSDAHQGCPEPFTIFFTTYFGARGHSWLGTQELSLVVFGRLYGMLGIEPQSTACKANALPLCYSLGLVNCNFQGASWRESVVQWGSHFLMLPDLSVLESTGTGSQSPQNQGPCAVLESALPSFTGGSKVHLMTGHLPQAPWLMIGESWAVPRAYSQTVCVKGAMLLPHGPTQMSLGQGL